MKKLRIIILNFSKKHHIILTFLRKILFLKNRFLYLFFYATNTVDDKLIVFESFMGKNYSDSEKAVYNYLLNQKADYTFVWIFRNPENYSYLKKDNTLLIKYGSLKYYKYYAKAKFWISNSRINEAIIKKKKQIYIQTWHGTPLKKLGYDIEIKDGNSMNSIHDIKKKYSNDSKRYSYMISPSKFCTEKYISAFNIKNSNIVKEIGYPRNDFLINYKKSDIDRIKKQLNLPKEKKIILYAPTWRDNQHQSGIGYTYNLNINFDKLSKIFKEDYIILFRTHYLVSSNFKFDNYKSFIYDVSEYDDINELYIISNFLITDYSSVFFDYALLKRPILFYMYDLDEYKNNIRNFYIDLCELPGEIVTNEKDLIECINKIDNFVYDKKYKMFNKKFNYLDDGKSSERLCKMCKILEKE